MRRILFLSLVAACGAPSASHGTTPIATSSASAPVATAAPVATPTTPSATAKPEAAPAQPHAEVPVPLTPAEQKHLAGACKPFVDAYQKRMSASKARGRLNVVLEGMEATLAAPPARAPATCAALFERETRGYVIATLGVDARVQLEMLARSMKETHAETAKLCPSSVRPVPPTIPEFYAKLSRDDWSEPTWKCLRVDGVVDHTSVQVEVVTKEDSATFVARGIPFPKEGKVVEWRLEARVKDGTLVYDKAAIVP